MWDVVRKNKMADFRKMKMLVSRSKGRGAVTVGKSTVPVPVAVVPVPVAAGRGAVTGPAGPVTSIVTHGTRIGPAAIAIGT